MQIIVMISRSPLGHAVGQRPQSRGGWVGQWPQYPAS